MDGHGGFFCSFGTFGGYVRSGGALTYLVVWDRSSSSFFFLLRKKVCAMLGKVRYFVLPNLTSGIEI